MAQLRHHRPLDVGVLGKAGSAPKIALLRGGGFGDFLSTTAALRALRGAFPRASLTLLTSPYLVSFARRYRAIDRIVVAPACPGVIEGAPDEAALARFFDSMRRESFDLALQWHGGGTHSNPFVRRLEAAVTVGFKGEDAEPLDYWIPYDLRQHEVLRYLDLLRVIGIRCTDTRMDLPVLPSDREELSATAGSLDLDALSRGGYIGIHASAGRPSRRWAAHRFAWVVDRLLEEFDFQGVVVTAGPGQEADATAVVESMEHRRRAVNLGGRLSLGALVALISQLSFFLSNDSGPSHMALALDVPSVVIFGAAHPLNWAPLERTWHRVVANYQAPCRWLTNDGCPDSSELECLQGVPPEAVLAEARQLLRLVQSVGGIGNPRALGEARRARQN